MIRWRIEPIEMGQLIIKYDKRFTQTGEPLWLTVMSATTDTYEVFDTLEDAQQTVELLIADFGGYVVDE